MDHLQHRIVSNCRAMGASTPSGGVHSKTTAVYAGRPVRPREPLDGCIATHTRMRIVQRNCEGTPCGMQSTPAL